MNNYSFAVIIHYPFSLPSLFIYTFSDLRFRYKAIWEFQFLFLLPFPFLLQEFLQLLPFLHIPFSAHLSSNLWTSCITFLFRLVHPLSPTSLCDLKISFFFLSLFPMPYVYTINFSVSHFSPIDVPVVFFIPLHAICFLPIVPKLLILAYPLSIFLRLVLFLFPSLFFSFSQFHHQGHVIRVHPFHYSKTFYNNVAIFRYHYPSINYQISSSTNIKSPSLSPLIVFRSVYTLVSHQLNL